MKPHISILKGNRGMYRAVIATVVAVGAILIGAYIDLKLTPGIPLEEDVVVATSTEVQVASKVRLYENTDYEYSFEYPRILLRNEEKLETKYYADLAPSSIFTASFPEEYTKGSNLISAALIAGAKNSTRKECLSGLSGNSVSTSTPGTRIPLTMISIGDVEFAVVSVNDVSTSTKSATTRYSTMHDGLCYSVSVVAKSFGDIDAYNVEHPSDPVIQYDQANLDSILDEVMQTFTFTNL